MGRGLGFYSCFSFEYFGGYLVLSGWKVFSYFLNFEF